MKIRSRTEQDQGSDEDMIKINAYGLDLRISRHLMMKIRLMNVQVHLKGHLYLYVHQEKIDWYTLEMDVHLIFISSSSYLHLIFIRSSSDLHQIFIRFSSDLHQIFT